jgi:hypothetical protein
VAVGHVPLEKVLLQAIAAEADALGLSPEDLLPAYFDSIEQVRAIDCERAPERDERNQRLDMHLRELRESYRGRQRPQDSIGNSSQSAAPLWPVPERVFALGGA